MPLHALGRLVGAATQAVAKTATNSSVRHHYKVVQNWVSRVLMIPPFWAGYERSDKGSLEFGNFSLKMEKSSPNPRLIVGTSDGVVAESLDLLAYTNEFSLVL